MKPKMKWTAALAVLLLALGHLPLAWGQVKTKSGALSRASGIQHPKALERLIFKFANEARRKNGLISLDWDNNLAVMAQHKSDDMLANNYFGHTSPEGKTFKDRLQEEHPASFNTMSRVGENIYMGNRFDYTVDIKTQARLIVDGWMTSPGHRRNMLDPNFTHMGIGVAARDKTCYATQIFGKINQGSQ